MATTAHQIVSVRNNSLVERKEILQVFFGETLGGDTVVDDGLGQGVFGHLPLEDLLVDGAGGEQTVDPGDLGLPVAPDACHGLVVGGGGPVGIEEDQPVGTHQV